MTKKREAEVGEGWGEGVTWPGDCCPWVITGLLLGKVLGMVCTKGLVVMVL